MKIIFEGTPIKGSQDSGMAKDLCFDNGDEHEIFVRVQSWDETKKHTNLTKLLNGGTIRVTIENIKE